jgi:hypothetical protein
MMAAHVALASPAIAQQGSMSEFEQCAFMNLAHYYLKCAHVQGHLLSMLEGRDAKLPKKEREALKKNTGDRQVLMGEFVQLSSDLYKLAGKELTAEIMLEKGQLNSSEMKMFADEIKRPGPSTMWGRCERNELGQEIRDDEKVSARLRQYLREAKDADAKNKSCLK